jgi:hypothetical protein
MEYLIAWRMAATRLRDLGRQLCCADVHRRGLRRCHRAVPRAGVWPVD